MSTDKNARGRPRCGATKRDGSPCRHGAGWGTDHAGIGRCKLHGGSTPTHRRSAEVECQRRAVASLGLSLEVDPAEALLDAVHEAAANVAFLREIVSALPVHPEPDELVGSSRDSKGQIVQQWRHGEAGLYRNTFHVSGQPTGEARPNVLLTLYSEERDRLVRYAKAALDAGVEERRVRLAEAEAADLFAGIGQAIRAAAMTAQQAEVFQRSLADSLRARQPLVALGAGTVR